MAATPTVWFASAQRLLTPAWRSFTDLWMTVEAFASLGGLGFSPLSRSSLCILDFTVLCPRISAPAVPHSSSSAPSPAPPVQMCLFTKRAHARLCSQRCRRREEGAAHPQDWRGGGLPGGWCQKPEEFQGGRKGVVTAQPVTSRVGQKPAHRGCLGRGSCCPPSCGPDVRHPRDTPPAALLSLPLPARVARTCAVFPLCPLFQLLSYVSAP